MVSAIRKFLHQKNLDAIIMYHTDPHQSEYVAPHWQIVPALSNFSGSNATIIITQTKALLWTDSRYWIQAKDELSSNVFKLQKYGETKVLSPEKWLIKHLQDKNRIGVIGEFISQNKYQTLSKSLYTANKNLVILDNFLADIWKDQPPLPISNVNLMPRTLTSMGTNEKVELIREKILENGAEAYLISNVDDISWLLNARALDIPCNTGIISYIIVAQSYVYWFVNEAKLSDQVKSHFANYNIEILPYNAITEFITAHEFTNHVFAINPETCQAALCQLIPQKNITKVENLIALEKSIKTKIELRAIRNVMNQDGLALTKAFYWLEKQLQNQKSITEHQIAQQLTKERSMFEDYVCDSFQPIVGWQENGAIVHYHPTEQNPKKINGDGVLLCDSGGHYWMGTTDITRTFCFGKPSIKFKKAYTLVLKGHIALASSIFPKGTTGVQLDVLARQFLWKNNMNYGHGTGHGVGFCANVHEGPQSISPRVNDRSKTILQPGMLITNEPGYYLENEFGIRIENILFVKEIPVAKKSTEQYYKFETLSIYPIEVTALEMNMLSFEEINWINRYHLKVREKLIPKLQSNELKFWLMRKTRQIGI